MPTIKPVQGIKYAPGGSVSEEVLFGTPISEASISSDRARVRNASEPPQMAVSALRGQVMDISPRDRASLGKEKTSSIIPVLAIAGIGIMILAKR